MISRYNFSVNNIINDNDPENDYFNPALFKIIQDYLYLFPLWTGVLLGDFQYMFNKEVRFTRLTNNPVENWFKILKHNVIANKRVMPSQFVGSVYNKIQSKYLQFYLEELNENLTKTITNNNVVECWSDRKKRIQREKGYYYKPTSKFNRDGFVENEINTQDFEKAFGMNRESNCLKKETFESR